jgi:hypothetical protein
MSLSQRTAISVASVLPVDDSANVLWLRKWKQESLAQTGDARKFHIVGDATLESRNEAGSGIVADLI